MSAKARNQQRNASAIPLIQSRTKIEGLEDLGEDSRLSLRVALRYVPGSERLFRTPQLCQMTISDFPKATAPALPYVMIGIIDLFPYQSVEPVPGLILSSVGNPKPLILGFRPSRSLDREVRVLSLKLLVFSGFAFKCGQFWGVEL